MLRASLFFIIALLIGCDSGGTQNKPVIEPIVVNQHNPSDSKNLASASSNISTPSNIKAERNPLQVNDKFLIGRWRSESYELYGRNIEEDIEFTPTQKKSGKSNFSYDVIYSVEGDAITVRGTKSEQSYKALDVNTVSYEKENVGTILLHRIAPPVNAAVPKENSPKEN